MIFRRTSVACTVFALGALALGACGSSDEDDIRALTTDVQRLQQDKRPDAACALMTRRAQAQAAAFAGTFGEGGGCADLVSDPEEAAELPTARDVEKAKVAIRGDRAVLTFRKRDLGVLGYRKVDGEWRVDNLMNPRLDELPRRLDPALAKGTDDSQVRATYQASARAFARSDRRRACDLLSYEAEAQLLVAAAFSLFAAPESEQDPAQLSCARAVQRIEQLAGDERPFGNHVPRAAELAAARVSVRGDRATIRVRGEAPQAFVRSDGRWLIAADREPVEVSPPPSAAALAACWRRAGAPGPRPRAICASPRAMRCRGSNIQPGRASIKGRDWRIFYALKAGDVDPGLAAVLDDPGIVPAVAYVRAPLPDRGGRASQGLRLRVDAQPVWR